MVEIKGNCNMPTFGKKPSLWEMLLQHAIVFLICVVFPGLTTLFAPATWLNFVRNGEVVRCTTRTCVFFIVPFKTQTVDSVRQIESRERAGRRERKREFGRTTNEYVNVDGEGFLQIHGVDDQGERIIEVSVSPASLKSVVDKSRAFLNSTQDGSTTIFTIANWKFGGLMGGVLTTFTALYVVGYSLGFVKWLFLAVKKTLPTGH